ncbi:unnamed protein product [Trichogramma brassicae]|uniref:Uncharacterized protein n=1 Tax=Trichogramma brassicae TaxID=86971 RepID=A0A6H5J0L9_9HYME|nr:unnamed protein product [Trichogramma brassicae]
MALKKEFDEEIFIEFECEDFKLERKPLSKKISECENLNSEKNLETEQDNSKLLKTEHRNLQTIVEIEKEDQNSHLMNKTPMIFIKKQFNNDTESPFQMESPIEISENAEHQKLPTVTEIEKEDQNSHLVYYHSINILHGLREYPNTRSTADATIVALVGASARTTHTYNDEELGRPTHHTMSRSSPGPGPPLVVPCGLLVRWIHWFLSRAHSDRLVPALALFTLTTSKVRDRGEKNHGQSESVALRPDPVRIQRGRETSHVRGLLGVVALEKTVGPQLCDMIIDQLTNKDLFNICLAHYKSLIVRRYLHKQGSRCYAVTALQLILHDRRLSTVASRTMAAMSLGFIVMVTPWTIQEVVAACTGTKPPRQLSSTSSPLGWGCPTAI